jgi:hypothetical protein
MLTQRFLFILAIVSMSILPMSILRGQDAGALLDLLVKKRLITDQEAEEVRAELVKDVSATSAGKWKLSAPITEIELYGDARMRYEYRGGQTSDTFTSPHDDWQERKRERYRLRLGLRVVLADDWFAGVRLETSTSPRSTNITFGDDSQVNGPFSKDSDRISVGQAYVGYKGFKEITLTAGRMPNPFIYTWMVWDPDINPEGLAEQWKHTFDFSFGGGESSAAAGYSKEGGKGAAIAQSSSEPFKMKIEVFANFGQFVYDEVPTENPVGPRATVSSSAGSATAQTGQLVPNNDAFLLGWQVGAKFIFPKNLYAQIAPTVYNYTGNGDTFNIHFQGGSPFVPNATSMGQNQNGINSLLVLDVPAEIGWKVGEIPMRVFGDFAVNFEGDERARAAGRPDKGDQRYSYVIGLGVGQLKQKHDWQIEAFWQHSEQYSLDPNLIDNDVFDARLNMQGVGVRAGYGLSDSVFFNLMWVYGWRIDHGLGTGGANDIAINPLDEYQILQTDVTVKF